MPDDRKKLDERKPLQVKLPVKLIRDLKIKAAKESVTIIEIVEAALREKLYS